MDFRQESGGDSSKATSEKKDSPAESIKKKGKLVAGTATGYYPFEMADKEWKLVGFDIDVAKALGKELGVEIEFQNYSFSGLVPALQAKKWIWLLQG